MPQDTVDTHRLGTLPSSHIYNTENFDSVNFFGFIKVIFVIWKPVIKFSFTFYKFRKSKVWILNTNINIYSSN